MTGSAEVVPATAEHGSGILSRICARVYQLIAVTAFLATGSAPTLAIWTLLDRSTTSVAVYGIALLPVMPAVAAGVYALRAWSGSDDLSPVRDLLRGYRRNLVDTLKWWTVVLLIGCVATVNWQHPAAVPGGTALRPVWLVILALLGVVSGHLVTITSLFAFRTRDAVRIAAYEVFARWRSSLGFLALMIVAALIIAVTSEAALLLVGGLLITVFWLNARPVERDVLARFVRPA